MPALPADSFRADESTDRCGNKADRGVRTVAKA